jgi:hypothetical protein
MGADTISLSGLEKDVYEDSISEGVNNAFDLKDWFKLEGGGLQRAARVTVWNHHHGRNVSPFFANEDSAYPVAGNQNSSKGRIKIKKIMARIRLTEEAMEDLVSSEASFRNGMTDEKTRLIDDISRVRIRRSVWTVAACGAGERHGDGRGAAGRLSGRHSGARSATASSTSACSYAAIDPTSGYAPHEHPEGEFGRADGTSVTFDSSTFTGWADNDYLVAAANGSASRTSSTRRSKRRSGVSRRSWTTAPTATTTSRSSVRQVPSLSRAMSWLARRDEHGRGAANGGRRVQQAGRHHRRHLHAHEHSA